VFFPSRSQTVPVTADADPAMVPVAGNVEPRLWP